MNAKVLYVLYALVLLAAAMDCKAKIPNSNGKTYLYDLSKLNHNAGDKDTLWIRDDMGDYVYMNVCGPSSEKCESGTAVCMRTSGYDYVSLGKVSSQEFTESVESEPGKGVMVTYSDGDDCDFGDHWQTVISFLCDETEDGVIDSVDEGECWYRLTVLSKYACGTETTPDDSGASDTGDVVALVILLIMVFGLIAYFVLGAVYQKMRNDPGTLREYIIHNEFWCSLPGLIVDGCKFIAHGCKKGDYVSV